MENLLDLSHYAMKSLLDKGADDVVLNAAKSSGSQIKFVNNKIAKTGTENLIGMSFFVVKDKKLISTSVKDVLAGTVDDVIEHSDLGASRKKIDEAVAKTMKFLKMTKSKDDYYGLAKGPFKYKKISGLYDKKIADLSGKEQIDYVLKGITAAKKEGAKRCSGIFETGSSESVLLTSNKVENVSKDSSIYFSIRAFIDKQASGHMTNTERTLKKLDVASAGKFAGNIASMAKNPVKGEAGKYDVVFAPMAFAVMLARVGSAASKFDVEAGTSFFGDSKGKKVGSNKVNLVDDGTLPGGLASAEYDAEGVPRRKTPVIQNGVFKNYLYNTSLAKKYKTKTTGNAGLIAPSTWNTVLKSGKSSRDKLIKQIDDGLYVTNVWYMRFQNYITGDFSVIPRDGILRVKKGKIQNPVKNIRVRENMINILKNVKDLGNDSKQMFGWEIDSSIITPHVLVKDVGITKPTK